METGGGRIVFVKFVGGGCNIETTIAMCELSELDGKSWGGMTFPFHPFYHFGRVCHSGMMSVVTLFSNPPRTKFKRGFGMM